MPRPRVVQFSLTEEEFEEVCGAAIRAGLARGAFAAEVTLAAARGTQVRAASPLRGALIERGEDLLPAAQFCVRVIHRLDEAAEHVRRNIP